MASGADPVVRDAEHDDVGAICRFGEAHSRLHYVPLIGAANAQVWGVRDRPSPDPLAG